MADDDRPEPLVAFITRRVQTDIARRNYEPGARLSPSTLATEYGVSHIPVREALSSLAAKGYIVHHQSRGFFARDLSDDELQDIYRWRRILETEAYRDAVPNITRGDIAQMKSNLAEMQSLTSNEDRIRYLELNRDFHFIAFRRAGSPILLDLLNYLWDVSAPYVAVDLIDSKRAHRDHTKQVKLYEKKDVEGLLQAMDEHRGFRLAKVAESKVVTH